jgi:hypothetical protein
MVYQVKRSTIHEAPPGSDLNPKRAVSSTSHRRTKISTASAFRRNLAARNANKNSMHRRKIEFIQSIDFSRLGTWTARHDLAIEFIC